MAQPIAMDDQPYTSSDFHNDVHKQLVNSTVAALSDTKLLWSQIAPFLDAGRALCRDDVRLNGRFAIHGLEYQEGELAPSDEAYLSISVRDREDGVEWLSETYWLSDIALADEDPERVRSAVVAMERTLTKLRKWLDAQEQESDPAETAAPDEGPAGLPAA